MSDGSICFDPAPVHLGRGYGMRLQKALRRISLDEVMDEEFIIQDALPDQKRIRIHQRFNGDISGRYLGLYSQRLFAVQNDDGSFGYRIGTDVFFPKIYGNGRMLLGLTQYYRLTGDPRALRAAHGLVGYYRSIHDGALGGIRNDGAGPESAAEERLDRVGPLDLKPLAEQTNHRSDVRYRFAVRFAPE